MKAACRESVNGIVQVSELKISVESDQVHVLKTRGRPKDCQEGSEIVTEPNSDGENESEVRRK
jgi:hypothetical protein